MRGRLKIIKQFTKFGLVGVINTILSLFIYWVCVGLGIHYLLANLTSFLIAVAISYILNNIFTFRVDNKKARWSLYILLKVYVSYFLTGIVINSGLLWIWNDYVGINENISPILNLIITIPLNFFLNKIWAYRNNAR